MTSKTSAIEGTVAEYVTAMIGGQLFGLPISRVQDVFMPQRLTRVPLSSGEIAGVLNLRGRIVTVVDMRARLGLPRNDDGRKPMAVELKRIPKIAETPSHMMGVRICADESPIRNSSIHQ